MKLLGRDFPAEALVERIEARLRGKSVVEGNPSPPLDLSGPEPRISPAAFYLAGMEEHADATRPLPLEPAATTLGHVVRVARWGLRTVLQAALGEALARQVLFNGHVRDAYAQLSAELLRLKEEVEDLKGPLKDPKAAKPQGKPAKKRP